MASGQARGGNCGAVLLRNRVDIGGWPTGGFGGMITCEGVEKLSDVNEKLGGLDYTKIATNHITLLVKNYTGLKKTTASVAEAFVT